MPTAAAVRNRCQFDLLFSTNVPHVLSRIFLCLCSRDFARCRRVCRNWRNFIDSNILGNPSLSHKVTTRRLLDLWHSEDSFVLERNLPEPPGLRWSEVDVEGVCCSGGNDVFLASQNTVFYFRDFKLVGRATLPEGDKVKRIYLGGDKWLLALSKVNSRCFLFHRSSLEVARIIKAGCGDGANIQRVGESIFFLRRTDSSFAISEIDSAGAEVEIARYSKREMVKQEEQNYDISKSRAVMNENYVVIAHENGWLNLLDHHNNKDIKWTVRYSESPINHVKKAILTDSFFGVIFGNVSSTTGQQESGVNFRLFSNGNKKLIAEADRIATYGRTYFSATAEHFVFSYADAMHNQHFLLHRVDKDSLCHRREFVLLDRPQPMRSMQILRDRLLILSFYRTASALNVFRLDQLMSVDREAMMAASAAAEQHSYRAPGTGDQLEVVKRLPRGVIAFQSSHDECNSQKLVTFGEEGILCQRLDYSCQNLVLSLGFSREDKQDKHVKGDKRKLFRIKWK